LGLHEHRAEAPWIDLRKKQRDSWPELDGLLRVPAKGARIDEQNSKSERKYEDRSGLIETLG
jgi:hypothetical protein